MLEEPRHTRRGAQPRYEGIIATGAYPGTHGIVGNSMFLGIEADRTVEGRVLLEALAGGPDEEKVPVETRVFTTSASRGEFRAAIQVSHVGRQRYVDKSWRIRP